MRASEALEAVGKMYVPGVVDYYAKRTPDPWQEAHDRLEKAMIVCDEELTSRACDLFVSRCRSLVEHFLAQRKSAKPMTPADAFTMGDETRVDEWYSIKYKQCVRCQNKEGLKLLSIRPGSMDVVIICRKCEKSYEAETA